MEQKNTAVTRLRKIFPLLERLSPTAGAWLLERVWFRVRQRRVNKRVNNRLKNTRSFVLYSREREIPMLEWPGQGATALLQHGWGGNAAQMAYIGSQLAGRGFHVYAFDAPAHGLSAGKRTNVVEMATALQQVVEALGGIDTLITHSYGGVVALYAIHEGMPKPTKLVLLSPLARVEAHFDKFCTALHIGERIRAAFRQRLDKRFGANLWQRISPLNIVTSLELPGLIVHDENDRVVPASEAKALNAAWRNSELMMTSGLGHRRLLKSSQVVERIVASITPAGDGSAS